MRGTERVHQEFPLRFALLLIVTRMGRDYRPGLRKRIEQVTQHRIAPTHHHALIEHFTRLAPRPHIRLRRGVRRRDECL